MSKIEMGKKSPRTQVLNGDDCEDCCLDGKLGGHLQQASTSHRLSHVKTDRQNTTNESRGFPEEGSQATGSRYAPKANIIRLQYTNGDTYEGNINGSKQRDGYGVYVCADRKRASGYEYQGQWKEDAREGKLGKCYYYNEGFYIGDWQQDQRHGHGEHFYKYHEERYIGGWRYDMRYGLGTLLSNGRPDSSGNGGGMRHYEGKFKEDRQHGRGILKVTQNHHRYSTKQKEVKVYEQEWRAGRLVYQKKIHTVVGEEQIANLMLNTQFINTKKHSQLLLQIYARNARGEIHIYENIKVAQMDAMMNIPEGSHNSKRKIGGARGDPVGYPTPGWPSQLSSEGATTATKSNNTKQNRERERSNALYRQDLINKIVGYYLVYQEKYSRGGSAVQSAIHEVNLAMLDASKLEKNERDFVENLHFEFEIHPEQCLHWKSFHVLTFLLHQRIDIQPLLQPFIDHKIDGHKIFTVTHEHELSRNYGIQKVGSKKNLIRLIRRHHLLLSQKQQEAEKQKKLQEQQEAEEAERRRKEAAAEEASRGWVAGWLGGPGKKEGEEGTGEQDINATESPENSKQGILLTDSQLGTHERNLSSEANVSKDQAKYVAASASAFTWVGAFQGISQYFWNTSANLAKEKKDGAVTNKDKNGGDTKRSGCDEDGESPSIMDQSSKQILEHLASETNDEFLDFEPTGIQQPEDVQAIVPDADLISAVGNDINLEGIGDESPPEKQQKLVEDYKEQALHDQTNFLDTVKDSTPVHNMFADVQILPTDTNTLDLGVSLATPALMDDGGKNTNVRPGAQSHVVIPGKTQPVEYNRDEIHTQIDKTASQNQGKVPNDHHRIVGEAASKPHNWMGTEHSSVIQNENSSINFVSQVFDFKGKQQTAVKGGEQQDETDEAKDKVPERQTDKDQGKPAQVPDGSNLQIQGTHAQPTDGTIDTDKNDTLKQVLKQFDKSRDLVALNIQQQQISSSNNEKLKKQIVGNIGKIHGVNLDKVREQCNKMQSAVNENQSGIEIAGAQGQVGARVDTTQPVPGQSNATLQNSSTLHQQQPRLRSSSMNRSTNMRPQQRQLSHIVASQSSRQMLAHSTIMPQNKVIHEYSAGHHHGPRSQTVLAHYRATGRRPWHLAPPGSPEVPKQWQVQRHTQADRQERERLEIERRERRKQREMSKNLIDVLFQTEKDRERQRLRMEKEKLRASQVSGVATGRASSRGSRVVRTGKGAGRDGASQQILNGEQESQLNNAGQVSRMGAGEHVHQVMNHDQMAFEPEKKLADSEAMLQGGQQQIDGYGGIDEDDDDEFGNLDIDAYNYLLNTFNENGFSFYIDIMDLKLDYKNDFLGGGGYGEVFKALWMGNVVAVKRFGRKCIQKKSITDFIKEIEIINQVRHPNITYYMGLSFDEHSHYYMVTEYVARGSIFDLLHNNGGHGGGAAATGGNHSTASHRGGKVILEEAKIFKIIKELASALEYLHSKQILHCDLKSQNILLTDDWTVKICDFGLARYQEKFVRDNYGQVGTPHWMAPEILRGDTYTKAADVYSFGVILWELVSGEIPHKGRSHPQIVGSVGYHAEKLKLPPLANPGAQGSKRHLANGRDPNIHPTTSPTALVNRSTLSHLDLYQQQQPSNNPHLRKIIELCTKYEAEERPTFANILCYLQKIEQKNKRNCQVSNYQNLSKTNTKALQDYTHFPLKTPKQNLDISNKLDNKKSKMYANNTTNNVKKPGNFFEFYQNMMGA